MNKITIAKSLTLSFVALMLATFSATAATSIEGSVKDPVGRPIKGADVRIEAKKFSEVVRTDTKGHYVADRLAVGTYRVTLVIDGQVRASILNATTQLGKTTQLNFDLTGKLASANKHTHMVYVPADTGTHISGGRWVEVDDKGNIVGGSGAGGFSSVDKMRGSAMANPNTIRNKALSGN
jgi:hypothetical protein